MKKVLLVFVSFLMIGLVYNLTGSSVCYAQNKTMNTTKKGEKSLTFYAKLSGKNVVAPVKTNASGYAKFTFDKKGDKLHYVVHLKNIDSVTMTHIHHAPKGKNGPIAVWLFKGKAKSVKNGILSQGDITNKVINLDSLKTWMENGDTYVLVHTLKHPEGEIRGQIHESSGTWNKAK